MSQTSPDSLNVRRNPKATVERLRLEAAKNPVFNAVAHLLASRDRTRQQITISNLRITMAREGFIYKREDYEKVLKFLASLGFGRLDVDTSGKLRALKDIRITLQSIGYAALGKTDDMIKFTPAATFQALPAVPQQAAAIPAPTKKATQDFTEATRLATKLVVEIEGQPISFPLPKGLTTGELGLLLNTLFNRKSMDV